ncbi:hypothetical protein ATCC90586_009195 [Pythium insidiosum]|nr:hypothetical protein ATCC90586_009195 [Pythium insidiosum]
MAVLSPAALPTPTPTLLLLLLLLAVGSPCVVTATTWIRAPHRMLSEFFEARPVVEILFPPNDFTLADPEMKIEIAMRTERLSLPETPADRLVCIALTTVFQPDDVVLEDGKSRLDQTCFEREGNYTTFQVSGLVPGLLYSVSVGLVDRGRMLGYSTRTFEVASLIARTDGATVRMGIPEAMQMALQFHHNGERANAMEVYRRVLELLPNHHQATHLLGLAYFQAGDLDSAHPLLSRALERSDRDENVHNSIGLFLKAMGRREDALHHFERALALRPAFVEASLNRGYTLHLLGRWEEAMFEYRKVIATHEDPQFDRSLVINYEASVKEAMAQLCHLTLVTSGRQEAERCLSDGISRWSDDPRFHRERGLLMRSAGQYEIALVEFEEASRLGSLAAMIDVGEVLEALGDHNRNNRILKQKIGQLYQDLFFTYRLVYDDTSSALVTTPLSFRQDFHHNNEMPHGRLRVGFISRFLFTPAVGLFMTELLPRLNQSKYEVFAFGIGLSRSVHFTEQVEQIAEHVHLLPVNINIALEEVQSVNLDVLIYPELGMDKTTYFLALHRLAPLQAAWWGNPDTTGLSTIDYFITSEHEHPDHAAHYSEEVYQMQGMGIYHEIPPIPTPTLTKDEIRSVLRDRFDLPNDFTFYLSIEKYTFP